MKKNHVIAQLGQTHGYQSGSGTIKEINVHPAVQQICNYIR